MGRGIRDKGNRWERLCAKKLSKKFGKWRRMPGSGAYGTLLGDASIACDLKGEYPWWNQLSGEAKYGYGSSKQMTIKREWMQKIREVAKRSNAHACVLLKFKDVRAGDIASSEWICFDFETWNNMMKDLDDIWEHYLKVLEQTLTSR